jgi:uncharacterized protein
MISEGRWARCGATTKKRSAWLLICCLLPATTTWCTPPNQVPAQQTVAAPKAAHAHQIEWDVLLPAKERSHFSDTPPEPIHDYLGEGGSAARQAGSIEVNKKLDDTLVRIPGFIVPLNMDSTGLITTFFLVPYLGACIHVPPPPPNQLVYVTLSSGGVRLGSVEDAYWLTGVLHTQTNGTRRATAAYTLNATRMERYKY